MNSSRKPDVWNVKDYKQFRKIMKSFMSDKSMFRYGVNLKEEEEEKEEIFTTELENSRLQKFYIFTQVL